MAMTHMFRWIALCVSLLLAMPDVNAMPAKPAGAQISYVRAGKLIDVLAGRALTDQLIRIDGERIMGVGPWKGAPTDGPLTDWSDYTVMPGLIDMHTHLADFAGFDAGGLLMKSPAEAALMGVQNARLTLQAGFTTVHDVGCYRGLTDVALRDAINAGWVSGPRMNVVGAYITVPGGGGDITGFAPDVAIPFDMRWG